MVGWRALASVCDRVSVLADESRESVLTDESRESVLAAVSRAFAPRVVWSFPTGLTAAAASGLPARVAGVVVAVPAVTGALPLVAGVPGVWPD